MIHKSGMLPSAGDMPSSYLFGGRGRPLSRRMFKAEGAGCSRAAVRRAGAAPLGARPACLRSHFGEEWVPTAPFV